MNEKNFLNVNNLRVQYTSDGEIVEAVNGVSFSLDKGETLGLVGETGAGKTTIAKAILQILPRRSTQITEGTILLDGENILQFSEAEMRNVRGMKISMIFQDPMTSLNPTMTVGEQIMEVVQLHSEPNREKAKTKAKEMLEKVGIPKERYGEYPFQFSGGMKQRVVIAMALACNPELLLADEPTTALDVTIQAQVLSMMRKLSRENNTSIILITHDLGVVAENCDKVAVVYAGEIVEIADKIELFDHPEHPYTRGLFDALPSISTNAKRLKPIGGFLPDPTNLPKGCYFAPRCKYATEICRNTKPKLLKIAENHHCRCFQCHVERE